MLKPLHLTFGLEQTTQKSDLFRIMFGALDLANGISGLMF